MKTIKRLLIANRAEIAYRILQTAKRMGIHSIIVYSDADRASLATEYALNPAHRDHAEAHRLGAAPVGSSYLDQDRMLALARATGADAIHPGYGLLSENSDFARRVRDAGLIWVGPSPDAMDKVASKSRAKEIAQAAGVPTSPGYQGAQDLKSFIEAAQRIGYPVLLKATAGGGGRGIRKVFSEEELKSQIEFARNEAKNAFGDDEILLEKYIAEAHHVEVQVFGDEHGSVVHLGERDCSTQRRNQKLLEEALSPVIDEDLRARLTSAAVAIAKSAGYANAGTVEFLVTPQSEFYFLEMNTRLQVEHPVTELVTGLDLVEWQLRVACGEKLPLKQEQVKFKGHAIQARLYAEDSYDQYRPQTGRIEDFYFPPHIRIDHFLTARTEITPYYDSMLAKFIAYAPTREEARVKLVTALNDSIISGLTTNREFLVQLLESDFFKSGKTLTRTLDATKFAKAQPSAQDSETALKIAGLCFYLLPNAPPTATNAVAQHLILKQKPGHVASRESIYGAWSNRQGHESFIRVRSGSHTHELKLTAQDTASARLERESVGSLKLYFEGAPQGLPVLLQPESVTFVWHGHRYRFENALHARSQSESAQDPNAVIAPMAGTLVKVLAKPGDRIAQNQVLAVVEAMKMQLELRAARDGEVASIEVAAGAQVRTRQMILKLVPEKSAAIAAT